MYVAHAIEHLRDGTEESSKVFRCKEDALEWINKIANGFAGDNHTFKLFLLGKELTLEQSEVEVPQPSLKTNKFAGREKSK